MIWNHQQKQRHLEPSLECVSSSGGQTFSLIKCSRGTGAAADGGSVWWATWVTELANCTMLRSEFCINLRPSSIEIMKQHDVFQHQLWLWTKLLTDTHWWSIMEWSWCLKSCQLLPLTVSVGPQIMFEAIRGSSVRSDTAIDDIVLESGPCPGELAF